GDLRIPMQRIDGKSLVIDRQRDRGEPHVLDLGVGAKLQAFVAHRDAAFDATAQRVSGKVRQNYALLLQNVAGAARQVRGMKILEAQGNVVSRKTSFAQNASIRYL